MCSTDGLARRLPKLVESLEAAGRGRDDIIVAPRISVDQVPDAASIEAWEEAGADQLVIGTTTPDLDEIRAGLAHVAELAAAA